MDTAQLIHSARGLYSGRFQATLSTHGTKFPGYPFGSLVPYCLDRHGWPLLLLSHLAQHTQNIDANPKCALTIIEENHGDPQQLMRLTCIGDAEEVEAEEKDTPARYFRYFPDKKDFYQEFNFRFYRIQPKAFYLVGGFGAARWLGCDRMVQASPFSAGQEASIVKHMNEDLPGSLGDYLQRRHPNSPLSDAPVVMVGVDADGMDLRQEERLYRLALKHPVTSPREARKILEAMTESQGSSLAD